MGWFGKQHSVFAQTFHGPSVSQSKTPVEVFGWRNLPFTQKRAIKYESWTAFAHWKQIEQAFLDWFGKQDSVLAQTFHGPSVPQNKTHGKVFWFKLFTFLRNKSNKFWNLDSFCPLETNWQIFFVFIWKAGFSFGWKFAWPFSVTK